MPRGGGIGRLLRQLATEDWLGRLIDAHFKSASPERWVKPDYTIHPSGCGSPCARDIELGMLGHRPAVKERNRRRMDNGTDGHTRWQRYFADMGVLVAKEHPLRVADPRVSGRIDLVLQNPGTGALAVGEIKTTNSRKFTQLPTATADRAVNARALYAWHREWFLQFTWYCTFGDYEGRKFAEKFFLVENTDNQDYRIIWLEPEPEHIEECQLNSVRAQQHASSGMLIPRLFEPTSKECKGCERRPLCEALEAGEETAWMTLESQAKKLNVKWLTGRPQTGPGAQP